jgi:hypothetical protein
MEGMKVKEGIKVWITLYQKYLVFPRWRLEGGSRKRASYSEILERHWRHTLQAKPQRRCKTLTPPHLQPVQSTPIHVNGDTRRAPGPPDAHAQMAWEDVDKVSLAVCSTPTKKPGPDQHSPLDRPTSTQRKKRNWVISKKNNKDMGKRVGCTECQRLGEGNPSRDWK